MECHDSSVFLIRKLPLSITEALLKSMEWSWEKKNEKRVELQPSMTPSTQ